MTTPIPHWHLYAARREARVRRDRRRAWRAWVWEPLAVIAVATLAWYALLWAALPTP